MMTNHYRHATVAGATRRWLAALVVLLLALGSPLAAWAAGGEDEPEVSAAEETKDEPVEEAPAEEAPAEEAPAEEPPAEEPAPEPEPQPEPPPSPEPPQQGSTSKESLTRSVSSGDAGNEQTAQALLDGPGATSAGGVTPTLVAGNPTCPSGLIEFKVNGSTSGVYTDGTLTVNATFSSTPADGSLAWTSNIGLDAVIVKGGSNASLYSYSPESTGDSGLTSPLNENNGKYFGISHVSYCYDVETTIEVVKDLQPSDDDGLFNLQIDGSTEKADASDGDTTGAVTVSTGTHTVGETAGTGTSLGDYDSSIECRDEGGQGDVVASSSNAGPLNVSVGAGDAILCVITNIRKTGQLEVVKELVPDTDPGLFNLQIDGSTEKADASDGDTTGKVTVDTGTHTVGETAGTGTSLGDYDSDISCLDDGGTGSEVASATGTGPLNVEVGEDDDIVCTITNMRKRVPEGTIELRKNTEPDGAGLFNLFIKDDGGSTVDSESDVGDGTTGANTVSPGTYEVSETAGTGTSLADFSTTISCVDTANGDAPVTATPADDHAWDVEVGDEQDIVCTITNTRKTGELEVIKDLEPNDDPGLFDLQIDGSTEFADASDGDTTGKVTVDTGTHTVGEAAGTGTSLGDYDSDISCLDDGGTGSEVASATGTGPLNVEVGEDDDIVCTITNTRKTVTLEVIKDLEPSDDPGLFDLLIDGTSHFDDASDGDTTGAVTVNTGNHTVGEAAGTGTSLGDYSSSIDCKNDAGATVASSSDAGPLNVPVNEDIVCTITNMRKTGELEVIKDLSPDDDPGLFDLQIDGSTEFADASDGDTTGAVTVTTGTHTVGELAGTGTDLADYASDISCVDEGGQGAEVATMIGTGPLDVEVGDGDHIVCTITNVFIAVAGQPVIRVEKTNDADGDGNFRDQERGTEGDSVTFKVVIRNVSAVPVVITEITDTFGGQTINICPELIGVTINPGGSRTCFFTLDDYVPAPGELLENTVTVRGHSAEDETQTVEASDDSAVNSIEVLAGGTDRGTDEGTTLAFTGAELLVLALMALALIVVGTPLVILTRRRGEPLDG